MLSVIFYIYIQIFSFTSRYVGEYEYHPFVGRDRHVSEIV